MMRVEREADIRWLSFPYSLRGAQNALEKMEQGETLTLIVDVFAVTDLKSSLEDMGHRVQEAGSRNGQSGITLIVKKGKPALG